LILGITNSAWAATIIVPAGGNLQAAINEAQGGDTIIADAGANFIGPFTLPNKPGNSYITIQSSAAGQLPDGQRVSPANAALMPKLLSPGWGVALSTAAGAHHYKLVGIEFAPATDTSFVYDLLALGDGGNSQFTLDSVPHNLILDRCYIHAYPAQGVKRGIALNSANTDILNSYIAGFKVEGQDTQAICGWNGPGPFRIINNYLEAAGENVMFGGGEISLPGLVPSDIEIRRNHFTKLLSWKMDDPGYAGIHWSVKNLIELKNAQRVILDGNILENNWGDGQVGYAILLTPRAGSASWTVVQDVQITNNIIRHAGGGLSILGQDTLGVSQPTKRINVENNLFEDIDGNKWNGGGNFVVMGAGADQITFNHNTVFQSGYIISVYGEPTTNFVFNNNIMPHNLYGIIGDGVGPGLATLSAYMPGAAVNRNIIAGAGVSFSYPPNNFFPVQLSDVQFVDVANHNYRLAANSTYKYLGTDGKDIGCDFDRLDAAIGGGQSTPTPTPLPTSPLRNSVLRAKRDGQDLSNQVSSSGSIGANVITALTGFVSKIQEAYALLNGNRDAFPAAARIDVALQAASAAASQASLAATVGDLAGLKSHLREAINQLALSDVLITYGDVANPIDVPSYMVRQQYVDFLNREPDQAGGDFWVNQIVSCGSDAHCVEVKRINVSAAFFLSIEFQQTGYYVYRLYKSSYGRVPTLQEFLPDNVGIASGVIVGADGWEAKLAGNKAAFVQSWVQRADFQARYGSLTNEQYVDALIANTGVTTSAAERDVLVQDLGNGASRANVLAKLADSPSLKRAEFNSAFLLMQYFGYLGRDPDSGGFNFWLSKLNEFGGDFVKAEMVKAFLSSTEYRRRFGR
jgi:hypothetical protein